MACISKISAAILYDCDSSQVGYESALLINKEDILSYAVAADGRIDLLTLKTGASAYKLDAVKRTLVMSESLKVNEGAPNAFNQTATIVCTTQHTAAMLRDLISPAANGSFVIITRSLRIMGKTDSTSHRIYGLYYGLSASAIDRNSHDNGGWYTLTLSTPDRVLGEYALGLTASSYETLYSAAVG